MAGPVGEDQAVAVLAECGEDVRGNLPGALLISGQVPEDGRYAASIAAGLTASSRLSTTAKTCGTPIRTRSATQIRHLPARLVHRARL